MSTPDFDLGPQAVTRVREAADMVQVVGDHVRLRRRGRRWEGLCPFHEEKTPSFSIDPEKGLYYCFGCHKGGDVIGFVMQLEGLSFPDAVEHLARRFGVPLPARRPEERRRRQEADRLGPLLEEAQTWFAEQLATQGAAAARRELERRGFASDTWDRFGFGYAPDDWRRLLEHLGRRHTDKAVVAAGLAVDPGSGKPPYDRFRRRITFPIRSRDGSLVAFGGRLLGDGEPKYLNSPEGPLFEKRSTLFLLDRAWQAIGSSRTAVVVEGYFDCLQLHRVGVANAVATLGTSLTEQHARILKGRIRAETPGERVLVCYDADPAGRRAAARGAGVLLAAGVEEVAVVVLPPGQDPDDVVRAGGEEAIRELIERPRPLLEFLFSALPEKPADRRRHAATYAGLVCAAREPATRRNLVEELARLTSLPARDIEELGASATRPRPSEPTTVAVSAPVPPGEKFLVRVVLEASPTWRQKVLESIRIELLQDVRVRGLFEAACAVGEPDASPSQFTRAVLEHCDDPEATAFVAQACAEGESDLTDEKIRVNLRVALREQARNLSRSQIKTAVDKAPDGSQEQEQLMQRRWAPWKEPPEI